MSAFDSELEEFLAALKPSTSHAYRHALKTFEAFYVKQGSIEDFLEKSRGRHAEVKA